MSEQIGENLTLEMSRTIRAPRKRVFAAFASADELKKWFGPGDCHVTEGEMDIRVDGGTEVRIQHEGIPAAEVREGHKIGWDGSFDKLGRCYGGGD